MGNTVRMFYDIEEAISREIRRITFFAPRTKDKTALQDTFDPFTGEIIQTPIEANYYDSSADPNHIQYPHFFVRLLKSKEDLTTGRVVPEYGKWIVKPNTFSPGAYEIVAQAEAIIQAPGNDILTTMFQINKIQPGYLIRMLAGNNKGTYIVSSVTPNMVGDHIITVSNVIVENLTASLFDATLREVVFESPIDINTVKIGDVYTDASSNSFNITAVDPNTGKITIDGTGTPDLAEGGSISRTGNVFTDTDLSLVRFIVMDPTKPVIVNNACGEVSAASGVSGVSPGIPLDVYYLVRIDSKERQSHIEVLNRMWEEFNPPRTALPLIIRSSLSAEQVLTQDIASGGTDIVDVGSNNDFSVGDTVFIIDDLHPTKKVSGEGFERPFESTVIAKIGTDQLQLADSVPDTYTVANGAKVVSNAAFRLVMFHFVDHVTKDVEGSQYWVHEFTFWVQVVIDRLETPSDLTAITGTGIQMEDFEGNIIDD